MSASGMQPLSFTRVYTSAASLSVTPKAAASFCASSVNDAPSTVFCSPSRADDGRKFVCRYRFELEFEVGAPVFRVDAPAADVRERFGDFCRGICAASGILRFARARPARILRRGVFGSLRALMLEGKAFGDEFGVVFGGVHRQVKGEFPDFRLLSLARMFFLPPCAEKGERRAYPPRRPPQRRTAPPPQSPFR